MEHVTDIVIFKLKDGTEPSILAGTWTAFLTSQQGFISRQLLRATTDPLTICDLIVWANADAGDRAFSAMQAHPQFLHISEGIAEVKVTGRFVFLIPTQP